MSDEVPVEKRFEVLVEITRASHFAWREAALRWCPQADAQEMVKEMWRITGEHTARAYLKRLTPSPDLARQVAESIVWSSRCMGEDASVEDGDEPGVWLVRHLSCPWHRWHDQKGLLAEDRPGCDAWFEATLTTINDTLGVNLRFATVSALPDGDDSCLRRIWTE